MSSSPENKEEVMPLRRSTRKSVAAKTEEQVLTPRKRKSTATPLKNAPDKSSELVGTPRRTRGAATPRKSIAENLLTPKKSVSNTQSEGTPKKKQLVNSPKKTTVTDTSPISKRTPRKSRVKEDIPKINEADEREESNSKVVDEEVTVNSRGRRKSVTIPGKKKTEKSGESNKENISENENFVLQESSSSEKDVEANIHVSFNNRRKSRKSVHFKSDVDEHTIDSDDSSPTDKNVLAPKINLLAGVEECANKCSLAVAPKDLSHNIKLEIKEANPAEIIMEGNTVSQMPEVVEEAASCTDGATENINSCSAMGSLLDSTLLSPKKFLNSDDELDKSDIKEPTVYSNTIVNEPQIADMSYPERKETIPADEIKHRVTENIIRSENESVFLSPRRKLSYEQNSNFPNVSGDNNIEASSAVSKTEASASPVKNFSPEALGTPVFEQNQSNMSKTIIESDSDTEKNTSTEVRPNELEGETTKNKSCDSNNEDILLSESDINYKKDNEVFKISNDDNKIENQKVDEDMNKENLSVNVSVQSNDMHEMNDSNCISKSDVNEDDITDQNQKINVIDESCISSSQISSPGFCEDNKGSAAKQNSLNDVNKINSYNVGNINEGSCDTTASVSDSKDISCEQKPDETCQKLKNEEGDSISKEKEPGVDLSDQGKDKSLSLSIDNNVPVDMPSPVKNPLSVINSSDLDTTNDTEKQIESLPSVNTDNVLYRNTEKDENNFQNDSDVIGESANTIVGEGVTDTTIISLGAPESEAESTEPKDSTEPKAVISMDTNCQNRRDEDIPDEHNYSLAECDDNVEKAPEVNLKHESTENSVKPDEETKSSNNSCLHENNDKNEMEETEKNRIVLGTSDDLMENNEGSERNISALDKNELHTLSSSFENDVESVHLVDQVINSEENISSRVNEIEEEKSSSICSLNNEAKTIYNTDVNTTEKKNTELNSPKLNFIEGRNEEKLEFKEIKDTEDFKNKDDLNTLYCKEESKTQCVTEKQLVDECKKDIVEDCIMHEEDVNCPTTSDNTDCESKDFNHSLKKAEIEKTPIKSENQFECCEEGIEAVKTNVKRHSSSNGDIDSDNTLNEEKTEDKNSSAYDKIETDTVCLEEFYNTTDNRYTTNNTDERMFSPNKLNSNFNDDNTISQENMNESKHVLNQSSTTDNKSMVDTLNESLEGEKQTINEDEAHDESLNKAASLELKQNFDEEKSPDKESNCSDQSDVVKQPTSEDKSIKGNLTSEANDQSKNICKSQISSDMNVCEKSEQCLDCDNSEQNTSLLSVSSSDNTYPCSGKQKKSLCEENITPKETIELGQNHVNFNYVNTKVPTDTQYNEKDKQNEVEHESTTYEHKNNSDELKDNVTNIKNSEENKVEPAKLIVPEASEMSVHGREIDADTNKINSSSIVCSGNDLLKDSHVSPESESKGKVLEEVNAPNLFMAQATGDKIATLAIVQKSEDNFNKTDESQENDAKDEQNKEIHGHSPKECVDSNNSESIGEIQCKDSGSCNKNDMIEETNVSSLKEGNLSNEININTHDVNKIIGNVGELKNFTCQPSLLDVKEKRVVIGQTIESSKKKRVVTTFLGKRTAKTEDLLKSKIASKEVRQITDPKKVSEVLLEKEVKSNTKLAQGHSTAEKKEKQALRKRGKNVVVEKDLNCPVPKKKKQLSEDKSDLKYNQDHSEEDNARLIKDYVSSIPVEKCLDTEAEELGREVLPVDKKENLTRTDIKLDACDISPLDLLEYESKESKKNVHIDSVQSLINTAGIDADSDDDDEDSDWLAQSKVNVNAKTKKKSYQNVSIKESQKKIKPRLKQKTSVISETEKTLMSSTENIITTKQGCFMVSSDADQNGTNDKGREQKRKLPVKGNSFSVTDLCISSENDQILTQVNLKNGFAVTGLETGELSGHQKVITSHYLTPIEDNSDCSSNKKTLSKKVSPHSSSTSGYVTAVLPSKLKKEDIQKAFEEVGIRGIVSIEYTGPRVAVLGFSKKKSLKMALDFYGQIKHRNKPIYVLAGKQHS